MSYNPNLGTPNRRPVSTYSGADSRNLPKTYAEAREAFERADKRKGAARGKLMHNTSIRLVGLGEDRRGQQAPIYAVRFHDTDVVTFYPDSSIGLDSDGHQTLGTRDRWNRCNVRVGTGGGVPFVFHGSATYPYVDGMRLKFRADGSPGMVFYPSTSQPVGTLEDIRRRRSRVLARERRANARGYTDNRAVPFYWPLRTGGHSPHRGTVPEVFRTDSECGLKPKTRATDAATAKFVSGLEAQ